MKTVLFIIALLLSVISRGQDLNDVLKTVQSKDFLLLDSLINTLSAYRDTGITGNWVKQRELLPGCQEAYGLVFGNKKDTNASSPQKRDWYLISVLVINNEIIFFDWKKDMAERSQNFFENFKMVDSFRNEEAILNLELLFKKTYGSKLNKTQLFSVTKYGDLCGVGEETDLRKKLNLAVANRDISEINSWLTAADTEMQVYAVDGLYQLKLEGYLLTSEQKRIIQVIKNKKGSISICSTCIYENERIIDIVKKFVFE